MRLKKSCPKFFFSHLKDTEEQWFHNLQINYNICKVIWDCGFPFIIPSFYTRDTHAQSWSDQNKNSWSTNAGPPRRGGQGGGRAWGRGCSSRKFFLGGGCCCPKRNFSGKNFEIGAPKKICPGPPPSSRRPCTNAKTTYSKRRQGNLETKRPCHTITIVLTYAKVWKISLIRWKTLTLTHTSGIGCIRKNFSRIRTHGLYDKHTLGTRWIR